MKVYLIYALRSPEFGPKLEKIVASLALAERIVSADAEKFVAAQEFFDQGRHDIDDLEVVHPCSGRVEVRGTHRRPTLSKTLLKTWLIAEHEVEGDVIECLAELTE